MHVKKWSQAMTLKPRFQFFDKIYLSPTLQCLKMSFQKVTANMLTLKSSYNSFIIYNSQFHRNLGRPRDYKSLIFQNFNLVRLVILETWKIVTANIMTANISRKTNDFHARVMGSSSKDDYRVTQKKG